MDILDNVDENFEYGHKKRTKIIPIIIGAIIGIIILVGGAIFIAFQSSHWEDVSAGASKTVYVFSGEDAKTGVIFKNKSSKAQQLTLDFGEKGVFKKEIQAKSSEKIDLDFKGLSEDTTLSAKYGFLNLSKIDIKVVVANSNDISVSKRELWTVDAGGRFQVGKTKYADPNTKSSFKVEVTNSSGKAFVRNIDFKINDQLIESKQVKWDKATSSAAKEELTFEHTFTKEGVYRVSIGSEELKFICAKASSTPKNGKVINSKINGGSGVLKVKNASSKDTIIVLANKYNKKKQLKMVVRAKKTATVNGVKDGSYEFYVQSGFKYSNYTKNFLDVTEQNKINRTLKFKTSGRTYSIWKIKLGVRGGNLNTIPIDELPN